MDSSQDKDLPATEHKLQKARKDGQAARSRDLSHIAVLGMGACSVLVLAPMLTEHLQLAVREQLVFNAATVQATGSMVTRLHQMALIGVVASLVFAVLTSAAAVVSAIGAGGWVFSFQPITPQFSRLNPISGFTNLVSKQQLVNVGKMVLMTGVITAVA